MKFLHAADLHLDSPLRGLERYEGAPVDELRGATRRALENLVQLAVDERVAFVVLAGDIYDGDWPDFNTGLFFVAQMRRLNDAKIPVVLIRGNHDAASKLTKSLPLPDNVTLLDHRRPQTHRLDDHHVAIHGQSFAAEKVTENLASGYPDAIRGWFNLGLLHTSLDLEAGGEHACYAPCKIDELITKGYDYWALGHIHTRAIRKDEPCIAFSGNLQGRHIRETGAKGCLLVDVDPQHNVTTHFKPLDVVRWERIAIDARGATDPDELLARFVVEANRVNEFHRTGNANQTMPLAIRAEFIGPTAAHEVIGKDLDDWSNQVRATAMNLAGATIWVEKVIANTTPIAAVATDDGPLGELRQLVRELESMGGESSALGDLLHEMLKKLPTEARDEEQQTEAGQRQWLRQLVGESVALLNSRLAQEPTP